MMIVVEEQFLVEKVMLVLVGIVGEIFICLFVNMLGYFFFGGLVFGVKLDMFIIYEVVIKDGWFCIGDVGNIDVDGCLCIIDCIKEFIKVCVYQVVFVELEVFLCSSGDVVDVGVVVIYDKLEVMEWFCVFVVLVNGGMVGKSEKDFYEFVQKVKKLVEEYMVKYKWLKGGIVFVDVIFKFFSGKIL